ncbi:unnamed protein product [Mucor hiemalis]
MMNTKLMHGSNATKYLTRSLNCAKYLTTPKMRVNLLRTFSTSGGGLKNSPDLFDWAGEKKPTLPYNTVVKFVPQQEAWIVERMGRFDRVLQPGLNVLVPILDSIRYVKTLKEVAVSVPSQTAITHDNVTLELDGVLYFKVVDPFKASYGVEDAVFAITQLAQTTMRAEIGQLTLDRTLAERAYLNKNIVNAINSAALEWGIQCLRYEIRDVHPPLKIVEAMHQQVSAERTKRAQILESEGDLRYIFYFTYTMNNILRKYYRC